MQNDINTQGHTQWFYFRVMNTRAKAAIKFNIVNFVYVERNSVVQVRLFVQPWNESAGLFADKSREGAYRVVS